MASRQITHFYRKRRHHSGHFHEDAKRGRYMHRRPQFRPRSQFALTNSLQPWCKNFIHKRKAGELGSFTTTVTNVPVTISSGATENGATLTFSSNSIPAAIRTRYQRLRIKKITYFINTESATRGTWQLLAAKDSSTTVQSIGDLRRQYGAVAKLVTTAGTTETNDALRIAVMWPTTGVDGGVLEKNVIFDSGATVTMRGIHFLIAAAAAVGADTTFNNIIYQQVDYIGYNKE